MAGKNKAVFGIYKSVSQAERAVDRIAAAGFSSNDISVLLPDNQSSREFAHEKNTKAPEGTTTGVTAGGAIGGTLGLLAGIGALAIAMQLDVALDDLLHVGRQAVPERQVGDQVEA